VINNAKTLLFVIKSIFAFMLIMSGLVSCSGFAVDKPSNITGAQMSSSAPAVGNDGLPYITEAVIPNNTGEVSSNQKLINREGRTVPERFSPPDGYERTEVQVGSFGEYLRNLPLKPYGSKVKYYDGSIKDSDSYEAVLDIDIGTRDLMQCADSVMRLRAEYLYGKKLYKKISFKFNSGFNASYDKWMNGYRIKVSGNNANWYKKTGFSNDYKSFREYLNIVFAYAGTFSLSKELEKASVSDIRAGDVFIKGGSPGHAILVIDTATNKKTGKKLFMLAQGYMPAQDVHILKNLADQSISPWYQADFGSQLRTPDWEFGPDQLKRFNN